MNNNRDVFTMIRRDDDGKQQDLLSRSSRDGMVHDGPLQILLPNDNTPALEQNTKAKAVLQTTSLSTNEKDGQHTSLTTRRDDKFVVVGVQRIVTFDDEDEEAHELEAVMPNFKQASPTIPSGTQNEEEEESHPATMASINTMEAKTKFDAVAATRIGQFFAGQDEEESDDDDDFCVWSWKDFELVRPLGTGGAATVYQAREVQSGYHVALKGQTVDDGLAESEIDVHEPLSHANIVTFYDYFYSDSWFGQPSCSENDDDATKDALPGRRYVYTILELCQGGSLYDVLRRQPQGRIVQESQAAQWIAGAMKALQYLHSRNILHCDVKTANFVLHASGHVKLTDFGFAVRRDDDDDDDDPSPEVEGGSVLYMAPEFLIAWRDGLEETMDSLDEGIDVYGLGVVLFELLVGDIPYAILEEHDENVDPAESMQELASCWEGCAFVPPIIDLQGLDQELTTQMIPLLRVPSFVSDDAQHLLQALLQPKSHERISLSDALRHPWIQKHLSTTS